MIRRETDSYEREAIAPYFDEVFYVAAYAQAIDKGVQPIDHFLREGWRLGFNPSRQFDMAFYLQRHADVAATGLNPLLHYAQEGIGEGRAPRRPLDTERRYLAASCAPSARAAHWLVNADRSAPVGQEALATVLSRVGEAVALVVSVSHDDYATNYGGIQNLLGAEQRALTAAGWAYLHVSPAAPLPLLAPAAAPEKHFSFAFDLTAWLWVWCSPAT